MGDGGVAAGDTGRSRRSPAAARQPVGSITRRLMGLAQWIPTVSIGGVTGAAETSFRRFVKADDCIAPNLINDVDPTQTIVLGNDGMAQTFAQGDSRARSVEAAAADLQTPPVGLDRKSTRLNSSHLGISYAVFCLKKKKH